MKWNQHLRWTWEFVALSWDPSNNICFDIQPPQKEDILSFVFWLFTHKKIHNKNSCRLIRRWKNSWGANINFHCQLCLFVFFLLSTKTIKNKINSVLQKRKINHVTFMTKSYFEHNIIYLPSGHLFSEYVMLMSAKVLDRLWCIFFISVCFVFFIPSSMYS